VQVAKIDRNPADRNYYLADACFLVNRYLKLKWISDPGERAVVAVSQDWWAEIDAQLKAGKARVFVLDVCIVETFKVLAKKRFSAPRVIPSDTDYKRARDRFAKDITMTPKEARKPNRTVLFHDVQTCRDIIIGVDRFFEVMHKQKLQKVGSVDLLCLSAGRYLMDFYGFTRKELSLVTVDNDLHTLAKLFPDVPRSFNPTQPKNASRDVFK
jgi:hypothetical protein